MSNISSIGKTRQLGGHSSEIKDRRFSPITLGILAINILTIVLLFIGMFFYYDQYESSLIQSELEATSQQADLFSNAIGETAVVYNTNSYHFLSKKLVQRILYRTAPRLPIRLRIFDNKGNLLADSMSMSGSLSPIETKPLAPPGPDHFFRSFAEEFFEQLFNILPSYRHYKIQQGAKLHLASEFPEILQALQGLSLKTVKATKSSGLVLTVAVPIQKYKQIVGALLLSIDGKKIEHSVRAIKLKLIGIWILASGITCFFSWLVSRYITSPIQKLAHSADLIRTRLDRKRVIPDLSNRNDEIGDLARALRQMTENLWQRMDAIERFAADVSHEIKNPLTSIQSAVETASKIDDKSKRDKLFMVILDDVQRMDRLVSDISEASRLDSELNRDEYDIIDVKQLVSNFFNISVSSERFAPEKLNIVIEDTARQYLVNGHQNRLMQVFRNLVDNATTFSPNDKPITIRCKSDQHSVYITVEDEGGGIPTSKLNTIFDRFYSERPSTEKFGAHSGLGLSICKQIVEIHSGNIWAENIYSVTEHKIGAKFVITLPKAKAFKTANKELGRKTLES